MSEPAIYKFKTETINGRKAITRKEVEGNPDAWAAVHVFPYSFEYDQDRDVWFMKPPGRFEPVVKEPTDARG